MGKGIQMEKVLFIIDPQIDFISPHGALPVPNATRDMVNIARFIQYHDIDEIFMTADSHGYYHISHPVFWKNINGENPPPFTVIKSEEVNVKWFPYLSDISVKDYIESVEKRNGQHIIWPIHCCTNTIGAAFEPEIVKAVNAWQNKKANIGIIRQPYIIQKGNNDYYEQHSPFSFANGNYTNISYLEMISPTDKVYFTGEAYSHCLKATVIDAINLGLNPKNVIILTDCTSIINGFDMKDFEQEYSNKGVSFLSSSEL